MTKIKSFVRKSSPLAVLLIWCGAMLISIMSLALWSNSPEGEASGAMFAVVLAFVAIVTARRFVVRSAAAILRPRR